MYSENSPKNRSNFRAATAIGCLVCGVLLSIPLYAQPTPVWNSASSFGGSGTETSQAVKVDRDGNRYVTGSFSATAYFPGRAGAEVDRHNQALPHALTSAGDADVYLAKYDRSGKLLWLTQAGGPEHDEGFDLAFDSAGNVYMTGTFTGSATFHGAGGIEKTLAGIGQTVFLAKYKPSGVLAWVQTGTTGFDSGANNGFGVAIEPITGSVYVTGFTEGDTTTFSSSNGTTNPIPGSGGWHMFLVKYDTAGKFHWGQANQAEGNTVAHKVAVDRHDNVYVAGWMEGQTTFFSNDGKDLTADGFSVGGSSDFPDDAYIVKYDKNGNAKWVNHIGGYKGIATDVATSADGRVSITGLVGNIGGSLPTWAETIVTSQPGGRNINLGGGIFTEPYNKDVFVATYTDAGVLLDARRFGGAQDEGGSGIVYDSRGNLIVAGIFANNIKIDRRTLTGRDPTNLFVAKFGRDERGRCGDADWAKAADGPGTNFENDPRIALTARGDVLVIGGFQPTAKFGAFTLESAGLDDGFLALLSEEHR